MPKLRIIVTPVPVRRVTTKAHSLMEVTLEALRQTKTFMITIPKTSMSGIIMGNLTSRLNLNGRKLGRVRSMTTAVSRMHTTKETTNSSLRISLQGMPDKSHIIKVISETGSTVLTLLKKRECEKNSGRKGSNTKSLPLISRYSPHPDYHYRTLNFTTITLKISSHHLAKKRSTKICMSVGNSNGSIKKKRKHIKIINLVRVVLIILETECR